MRAGDVVQFNENHEWCGCLGIIDNFKPIHNPDLKGEGHNDFRFMVGVPMPNGGTAYIFVLASENAIEAIGEAKLVPKERDDKE